MILVFLYCEVATSRPTRVHHFLHTLAAKLTPINRTRFPQHGFIHPVRAIAALYLGDTALAFELIGHKNSAALHVVGIQQTWYQIFVFFSLGRPFEPTHLAGVKLQMRHDKFCDRRSTALFCRRQTAFF
jgi:hypothetical protein